MPDRDSPWRIQSRLLEWRTICRPERRAGSRAGAGADHPGGATDATSPIPSAGLGPGPAARRRRRCWRRPPRACWWWRRTSTTSSPSIRPRPTSSPPASWSPTSTTGWCSTTPRTRRCWRPASPAEWADRPRGQDHHLHPARRRQVPLRQPGARRGRGLLLRPRGEAEPDAGLHPDPARLDPGEHRRDGHRRRQQGDREVRGRLLARLRDERARLAPGLGGRRAHRHGQRGERRHGQRLDERPFRRLRAVLAAGLPPGRAGAARPPSRTISRARPRSTASSSATWRNPRPSSSCCSRATWTWRRT